MNEHAGAASALSVVIVGLFAILLHDRQPSPPPRPPMAEASPAPKPTSRPTATTASAKSLSKQGNLAPSPAGFAPATAQVATRVTETPAPQAKLPSEAGTVERSPRSVALLAPETSKKPVPPPMKPTTPKAAFTVVQNGENLGDVANRVYGSSESAEILWKANRDQVSSIDSPLRRGTLLRTP